MLCSTFLTETKSRLLSQADFLVRIGDKWTPDQVNWKPDPSLWSTGQILDHMHLADAKYTPVLRERLQSASYGTDREVKFSLVGRLLIKANTNPATPAPKFLEPGSGPFSTDIVRLVADEYSTFAELTDAAADVDLVATRIRNPFASAIHLSLADSFEILAVHADRHLGQIEHLSRHPEFPR